MGKIKVEYQTIKNIADLGYGDHCRTYEVCQACSELKYIMFKDSPGRGLGTDIQNIADKFKVKKGRGMIRGKAGNSSFRENPTRGGITAVNDILGIGGTSPKRPRSLLSSHKRPITVGPEDYKKLPKFSTVSLQVDACSEDE